MQHVALVEQWSRFGGSRGIGFLHTVDARAKLAALLGFLIAVATTTPAALPEQGPFLAYGLLLVGVVFASRLPILKLLTRAMIVLPFSGTFALLAWWSGDSVRAAGLLEKSYLSGLAALLVVATTPFPELLAALESWRMPRVFLLTIQFLYRYLFVIPAQAGRMRLAAECRAGRNRSAGTWLPTLLTAASGTLGVLFARSWERADAIYGCMLARGFDGRFPRAKPRRFRTIDGVFTAVSVGLCLAIRSAL